MYWKINVWFLIRLSNVECLYCMHLRANMWNSFQRTNKEQTIIATGSCVQDAPRPKTVDDWRKSSVRTRKVGCTIDLRWQYNSCPNDINAQLNEHIFWIRALNNQYVLDCSSLQTLGGKIQRIAATTQLTYMEAECGERIALDGVPHDGGILATGYDPVCISRTLWRHPTVGFQWRASKQMSKWMNT